MTRSFCALALSFSVLLVSNAFGQWEQFQGNARHNGVANSSIDASTLTSAWSATAPAFTGAPGDLGVAIVDGFVYSTMRVGSYSAGNYIVNKFMVLTVR